MLIDSFGKLLPSELLNRNKMGFEVPLLHWFRTDLRSLIEEDLLSEKFISEQALFQYAPIERLIRKLHSSDPDDSVARIWGLMVFQYWWKKHFKA
jgi:asparagine synthase (glutamine-hydrolysing)